MAALTMFPRLLGVLCVPDRGRAPRAARSGPAVEAEAEEARAGARYLSDLACAHPGAFESDDGVRMARRCLAGRY